MSWTLQGADQILAAGQRARVVLSLYEPPFVGADLGALRAAVAEQVQGVARLERLEPAAVEDILELRDFYYAEFTVERETSAGTLAHLVRTAADQAAGAFTFSPRIERVETGSWTVTDFELPPRLTIGLVATAAGILGAAWIVRRFT